MSTRKSQDELLELLSTVELALASSEAYFRQTAIATFSQDPKRRDVYSPMLALLEDAHNGTRKIRSIVKDEDSE